MRGNARDGLGTGIGLLTFLAGVGILGGVFFASWRLYQTPPSETLGIREGQKLNWDGLGGALVGLLLQVLLLVAMALIGSMIAARGASLYGAARRGPSGPPEES